MNQISMQSFASFKSYMNFDIIVKHGLLYTWTVGLTETRYVILKLLLQATWAFREEHMIDCSQISACQCNILPALSVYKF